MSDATPILTGSDAVQGLGPKPSLGKRLRKKRGTSLFAHGEPMVWFTGGALFLSLAMIVGLLGLVAARGLGTFWPKALVKVRTIDGKAYLGEVRERNEYRPSVEAFSAVSEERREAAKKAVEARGGQAERVLYRTGNFEQTQTHYTWISDFQVAEVTEPEWAVTVERLEHGRFYGIPKAFVVTQVDETGASKETITAEGPRAAWAAFEEIHGPVRKRWERRRSLEKHDLGRLQREEKQATLDVRRAEIDSGEKEAAYKAGREPILARFAEESARVNARFPGFEAALTRRANLAKRREWMTADDPRLEGLRKDLAEAEDAVRSLETDTGLTVAAYEAAQAAVRARREQALAPIDARFPAVSEASHARERITARAQDEKRRIQTETSKLERLNQPYRLRFETADGTVTDLPVESIVRAYPANQLGFFGKLGVYLSRWWEYLSEGPREANSEGGVWPAIFGTVTMTLLMSILVVPFGVLAALYLSEYAKSGTIVSTVRIAINNLAGVPSIVFGVFGLGFFCYVVGAKIDATFFPEYGDTPNYGKGGLLWASVTLALLTLPVVIVATEEALAAVPGSMREGSYACGASKWQTIKRIVLPRALPGIMTGMILAVARGAGEVAPLMLVGAVKLAPALPVDGVWPFVHPDRSFMHLGFHIYDRAFQSENSEAAKPMIFSATLLLIAIVVVLNAVGMIVRARLRKKFGVGA